MIGLYAICIFYGVLRGKLIFQQLPHDVLIYGRISGLEPGYHGMHVHQIGNLSGNCQGAGPHFNPFDKVHGAPSSPFRHVGDLGNAFTSGDDFIVGNVFLANRIPRNGITRVGITKITKWDSLISLLDNERNIMGRALVVHALRDDLGLGGNEESLRTGNSGGRVDCCIIEPYYPPER
ncbi:unnamed protein product, partial [Gordionus sp. m RMFG-2023]